jgi:PGF-pre-PGF domain-containing protein
MPTGKSSLPASNWHGLLYVLIIAAGLFLSSFVDASHAVVSTEGILAKSFTSIIPEASKTVSEAELEPTDTKLTEIQIQVKTRVVASELSVEKYDSNPADAATDVPGIVYRYMSVSFTKVDDSNVQSAKIKFKIEKSWIEQNSVDASSAALYRYSGGAWNKLQTAKTGEDGVHVYYEAATPGFSYFAISAEKAATPAATAPGQATTSTVPGAPAPSATWPTQPQGWWAWIAAAMVLVTAATVLALKPKPPATKRRRRGRR